MAGKEPLAVRGAVVRGAGDTDMVLAEAMALLVVVTSVEAGGVDAPVAAMLLLRGGDDGAPPPFKMAFTSARN